MDGDLKANIYLITSSGFWVSFFQSVAIPGNSIIDISAGFQLHPTPLSPSVGKKVGLTCHVSGQRGAEQNLLSRVMMFNREMGDLCRSNSFYLWISTASQRVKVVLFDKPKQ